jgi:hypothetical protein
LTANQWAVIAGIFTAQPILDLVHHSAPSYLSLVASAGLWIMTSVMISQVFLPARPILPPLEALDDIQSPPPEKQKNQSLKLIALGVVLPLVLASVFPLLVIGLGRYFPHHPARVTGGPPLRESSVR